MAKFTVILAGPHGMMATYHVEAAHDADMAGADEAARDMLNRSDRAAWGSYAIYHGHIINLLHVYTARKVPA